MNTLFLAESNKALLEPYKIDCEECCGLCCVALYFSRSEGFPENKNAGTPCKNLEQDYKCKIHKNLLSQGLRGCMAYDCFGAGQKVTRHIIARQPDWKSVSPDEAEMIFRSYLTVMQIHQVLWYLTEAVMLRLSKNEKKKISALLEEGRKLTMQPIEILQGLDVEPFRMQANKILKTVCDRIRSEIIPLCKEDQTKNYMGKTMKHKKLAGKDFSSSLLIAANLEGADLYGTNFLGADMRDTNIQNTDLSKSIFLTQIQINAANGNQNTILPPYLNRPVSWKKERN